MRERTPPPALLRRIMGTVLPVRDREALLAELDTLYGRRVARSGRLRSDLWYALQVPSFLLRLAAYRVGGRAARSGRTHDRVIHGATSHPFARMADAASRHVRIAVRGLVRRPAYTITSAATLAIGVAAISVVHGVANWALLRPVPGVRAPDRLVTIIQGGVPVSNRDFRLLTEGSRLVTGLAAASPSGMQVSPAGGRPTSVSAETVTAGYFDVLGVRMAAGRAFTDEEVEGSASPFVAILSESISRRLYGSTNAAIGSELVVNGRTCTVIGVAGGGFRGESLPAQTELWVPAASMPELWHSPRTRDGRAQIWSTLIARPVAATDPPAIAAELNSLMSAARAESSPETRRFGNDQDFSVHHGVGLWPSLRAKAAGTLAILAAAAILLLLLACANVANLGLARAASLRDTIAVRRALGARGGVIVTERVTESIIVGLCGSAVGLILAILAIAGLRARGAALAGVPLDGIELDYRVFSFTLLSGAFAGMLAGAVPAIASRRTNTAALLRSGRHSDLRAARTGRVLVVVQVALSAVLLVMAGLLVRTLVNLDHIDLGVLDADVVRFTLDPRLQGYDRDRTTLLLRDLVTRLEDEPGTRGVAAAWPPPFASLRMMEALKRPESSGDAVGMQASQMTSMLFETLGIELIVGRTFTDDEVQGAGDAQPVAMLNESAARALFPELGPSDVPGRTVQRRGETEPYRIIGVVQDARLNRPTEPAQPAFFLPWSGGYATGDFSIYVHTDRPLDEAAESIRLAVARLDPALPIQDLRTWHDEIRSLVGEQRLVAQLALAVGGFGLLLAAVGLYGVLALAIIERTREIGIRSALGARPAATLWRVVGRALAMTGSGLGVGLLCSLWLSRYLESRLFGINRLDPATWGIGIAMLIVVALLASGLPAWRAMRIDPIVALRDS